MRHHQRETQAQKEAMKITAVQLKLLQEAKETEIFPKKGQWISARSLSAKGLLTIGTIKVPLCDGRTVLGGCFYAITKKGEEYLSK